MLEFVGSDLSRGPVGSSKPQVELDVSRRQLATRDGGRFNLTKLEFELTSYLSQHPGSVVTRDELVREVWKQPFGGSNPTDAVTPFALSDIRRRVSKYLGYLEFAKLPESAR
jgi:DNA-binding response OmpR family regulator